MPAQRRADAGSLMTMESRAASIGGRPAIAPGAYGRGTVELHVPLDGDGRPR